MEPVQLNFRYTQEEYVKAERQYLFASKTITKTSVVVLAVFLPFSLLYFFLSSYNLPSIFGLGCALFALASGCTLYFYIPVYKYKSTAKYHQEYSLLFCQDSISFKTPTIDSSLKWDVYSALWESSDYYFLIQLPRIYTLLPKRVFANTAEMAAFEELALSNLKAPKRLV